MGTCEPRMFSVQDIWIALLGGGAALILERLYERWTSTADEADLVRALRAEIVSHEFAQTSVGVVCTEFRATVFDRRYPEVARLVEPAFVAELADYYGDVSQAWRYRTEQHVGAGMLQKYLATAPARRDQLLRQLDERAKQGRVRRFLGR